MNKLNLLLCFILTLPVSFSQTENTWIKKASFGGLKREKAVAFSIDNFGYVSCGVDTAEDVHNDLWKYDPELDIWTQLASLPGLARKNAVSFVISGKGYVGTGLDHDETVLGNKLNDLWEYNPVDNSWTEKADYPGGGGAGIYQATAFSIEDKGYIVCGKIGSDNYIAETWEYNPTTDSWIERTSFPGGDRYQLMSFVLEGKAFVGLGTDHDVFRKDLWEYDPITNTWENEPDFPGSERAQASTFTLGTKAFVIFGTDGGLKDELWEYSFYTQSWSIRAPFPGGGRKNGIAFSIANKGYVGLGKESDGKRQSFYAYTPIGPLSINEKPIEITIYPNPIKTLAHVNLSSSFTNGEYLILSMDGKIIQHKEFTSNEFSINTNQMMNGTYQIIVLNQNQGIIATKTIFVL